MLWRHCGGARGLLMLASLAAACVVVPFRLGAGFVDPAILLCYSAFAVLFTSDFVTRGVVGLKDARLMRRTVIAGAVYGWLCWALILGASCAALLQMGGRPEMLPGTVLAGLALLTVCLSWLTATLGAVVSLSVYSVRVARDMLRFGFMLLLLVVLAGPSLLPAALRASLLRLLHGAGLTRNLVYACPALVFAGLGILHRAERMIELQKISLSILGDKKD